MRMKNFRKRLKQKRSQPPKTSQAPKTDSFFFRYPLTESLLNLSDIYKYFSDTFKPYKAKHQLKRDQYQLFRGLGNIISALTHGSLFILASIIDFLLKLLTAPLIVAKFLLGLKSWENTKRKLKEKVVSPFYFVAKNIFGACTLLVKGLIETITFLPLTLPRILWRLYYHYAKGDEYQTIQMRQSIIELLQTYDKLPDKYNVSDLEPILSELIRKGTSSMRKKQPCSSASQNTKLEQHGLYSLRPDRIISDQDNVDDNTKAVDSFISAFRK